MNLLYIKCAAWNGSTVRHQADFAIKQFVKLLRPICSDIVTINGKEVLVELEVPELVKTLLSRLSSGH